MSPSLTVFWVVGFVLRWVFLMPVRVLLLVISLSTLVVMCAAVGLLPASAFKRRLNAKVVMWCFDFVAGSLSIVARWVFFSPPVLLSIVYCLHTLIPLAKAIYTNLSPLPLPILPFSSQIFWLKLLFEYYKTSLTRPVFLSLSSYSSHLPSSVHTYLHLTFVTKTHCSVVTCNMFLSSVY